jgi:aminopeptidase-like protein
VRSQVGETSDTRPSLPLQSMDSNIGNEIFQLATEIFPICRSITGDGVRETLRHLSGHIDLQVREVPTGTQVFDWTIPREWNVRDAFIRNSQGERIVDFKRSNLHVLNYSAPIRRTMPLHELKHHIFTLPDQPDLIPYRTSYYTESWGFCMAHNRLLAMAEGLYEVLIDADLEDGHLTYAEYLCPGASAEEVLLTAHICHPSLANDNCSGLALLVHLAKRLAMQKTRYTYRILLAPGTIGAITWLALNEDKVGRIKHGLVVSCVGDGGGPTYKQSRRGNAMIDRAMVHVLRHAASAPNILDFSPYGYDERQYCSPGFNLPVGLFQRSQFGSFPEYHTSADNLSFIRSEHLAASYRIIVAALDVLERDHRPRSANPKCEPQLGRRGLYASVGGHRDGPKQTMALLWIMNMADGAHSLLDIAERADLPFDVVANAAQSLREKGLLEPLEAHASQDDCQDGELAKSGQDLSCSEMAATLNGQAMPNKRSL